jgi:holo-[acyl-carrier protein] synthase
VYFEARLFTAHERECAARVEGHRAERLAARFAAKEAFIKAFDLAEAGIGWRDVEVRSTAGSRPRLQLHGLAARVAAEAGVQELALSLSHDGAQACAMVVALCGRPSAEAAPAMPFPMDPMETCTESP